MNLENLSAIKFSDSVGYTIGNYKGRLFLYNLLSEASERDDPQQWIDDITEELTANPPATKDTDLIFDDPVFDTEKKVLAKSLDQERRIANDTFSATACRFCGSNRVKTKTYQSRGLDEPSTIEVKCLNPSCMKMDKYSE